MSNPVCPIHKEPMMASTKGSGFFCRKKMPDGTWCKEKAASPPTEAAGPASTTVVAGRGSPDTVLAAAALRFAADVWGPCDPSIHDEAIAVAVKAFKAMKAVCS